MLRVKFRWIWLGGCLVQASGNVYTQPGDIWFDILKIHPTKKVAVIFSSGISKGYVECCFLLTINNARGFGTKSPVQTMKKYIDTFSGCCFLLLLLFCFLWNVFSSATKKTLKPRVDSYCWNTSWNKKRFVRENTLQCWNLIDQSLEGLAFCCTMMHKFH